MAANSKEVPKVEVQQQDLGTLSQLDPDTLDPKFVYRFVHKSSLKVARARAKGYVIVVPAEEKILNAVGDSPEAEDGTYTVGDVVLMKCAKDTHRSRRHHVKRKTDARLKGPEKKFRKTVKQAGAQRGLAIEVITDKGD
jgi:hypothetical protein